MHTLRTLVWTLASVALGIALATVNVAGGTPWQHMQRAWRTQVSSTRVEGMRGAVQESGLGTSCGPGRHRQLLGHESGNDDDLHARARQGRSQRDQSAGQDVKAP